MAARSLLGALLVRDDEAGIRLGRITEVEAYIGEEDRASHARSGPTTRNRVMYGPPGIAYVYLVYGMHRCLNVVTERADFPAAVLVRAIDPLAGIDAMRRARIERAVQARAGRPGAGRPDAAFLGTRRARGEQRIAALAPSALARGPGLVGAAYSIDIAESGADLCARSGSLRLAIDAAGWAPVAPGDVVAGPRVGIAYAGEPWAGVPWRLALRARSAGSQPRETGEHR